MRDLGAVLDHEGSLPHPAEDQAQWSSAQRGSDSDIRIASGVRKQGGNFMAEITFFVALPFDFIDGGIAAGEPIDCPSPAAAIQRAQGLWKVFGHAGSVAFSRTTDFEIGKFNDKHVLRRFGQVTDEYR